MDINDLRGLATVFVLIAFCGICWWAFSPSRRERFRDAANLPFADEEQHHRAQQHQAQQHQAQQQLKRSGDKAPEDERP